jgi:hypothetical protein
MNDIRAWLDVEKIQPVDFRTVVGQAGNGLKSAIFAQPAGIAEQHERPVERSRGRVSVQLAITVTRIGFVQFWF